MTTPTLSEALDQLAGAVPADPDDHGPIAVPADAVRAVLTAVTVLGLEARSSVRSELESWVNTPRATQPETT